MTRSTDDVIRRSPETLRKTREIRDIATRIVEDTETLIQKAKALPSTAASVSTPDELRDQVLAISRAAHGGTTFLELIAVTGATKPRVRFALAQLRKDGRITMKGENRSARYIAKGSKSTHNPHKSSKAAPHNGEQRRDPK